MKSEKLGTATLEAEVANISRHGFWVFLGDRELFVSFTEFPWFEHAPVSKILRPDRCLRRLLNPGVRPRDRR